MTQLYRTIENIVLVNTVVRPICSNPGFSYGVNKVWGYITLVGLPAEIVSIISQHYAPAL